jgi:lipoate-protein ligase B
VEMLRARWLGRVPHGEADRLQRALHERATDDYLLLLEHPHVYTLGTTADPAHVLVDPATVGAELVHVDRGGDVTYHGPGQLVGYPILDLREHRMDLHWYLRTLEDALITALGVLGIEASRNPGLTGVWTAGRKIASIGIHVKQWVTLHGFALNVSTDLSRFDLVVPCGIQNVVMTSVAEELLRADHAALAQETRKAVVDGMQAGFGYETVVWEPEAALQG